MVTQPHARLQVSHMLNQYARQNLSLASLKPTVYLKTQPFAENQID